MTIWNSREVTIPPYISDLFSMMFNLVRQRLSEGENPASSMISVIIIDYHHHHY